MSKSRLANLLVPILITFATLTVVFLVLMHLFPKAEIAYAGDNIWTWAGVSGGVPQILTDPRNPSFVYANVNNNRIMKSTDGGNTWVNVADPSWTQISEIAMAFSTPYVIYAAVYQFGAYRSMDGGATWQLVHPDSSASAIAVSPVDWKEAYLVAAGADPYNSVISKTIDGGQTWKTIMYGLPPNHAIQRITIAPSAPHILIAKPWNTAPSPPNWLYMSVNAGNSWSPLTGPYSNVNVVTFDPRSSNTIYLGMRFSPGAWKSTNGGSTWEPLANGLQQNSLGFVIDPDNTQIVDVANDTAGVLETQDGGLSWTPINTGIQGLAVQSIAIASRNPLVIYAGLPGAGIWKMTRTTIQNYGVTANDGALFTNQTNVTLTLTAPPGTTQMQISNDGGFGGAAWEAFINTKPWTITAYGNYVIPRIVYAKFMTSGQVSGTYQDDIVLDQTPPTGTIQITGTVTSTMASLTTATVYSPAILSTATTTYTVYLPLVAKNYIPGFRLVGLSLSATDDVSGVDNMLTSNAVTFAGAQWQAYVQKLNWYVSETGTTTVYIKYRDRAGNESQVYSAVTTAP